MLLGTTACVLMSNSSSGIRDWGVVACRILTAERSKAPKSVQSIFHRSSGDVMVVERLVEETTSDGETSLGRGFLQRQVQMCI